MTSVSLSASLARFLTSGTNTTLVLTHEDVIKMLQSIGLDAFMDATITRLVEALRADVGITVVPRGGFTFNGTSRGLVEWMPVLVPPAAMIVKTVGYHPYNRMHHSLPTIVGSIALYDGATGCLRAIADGSVLTAIRTGAASAVATRWLAHPGARSLGLIGCGGQAVTQLHAVCRALPIERVLAFDVDPQVASSLSIRAAALGPVPEVVPRSVLERDADVICTATSTMPGDDPVLDAAHLRPWVHVNAVGSDSVGKVELPSDLLERSLVCPDFKAQAMIEGECQRLPAERVGPDLITLARDPARYAAWRDRQTVFDSTGFALEDAVVMERALVYACELGLGRAVTIDAVRGDALNPYALASVVCDSHSCPGLEVR